MINYLNPEFYNKFGTIKSNNLNKYEINGLFSNYGDMNMYEDFTVILIDILSGSLLCINQIEIDSRCYMLLSTNTTKCLETILLAIYECMKKIKENIQNKLNEKKYTNKWLIDIYNTDIYNFSVFKKSLIKLKQQIVFESGANILNAYITYLYYEIVINTKYYDINEHNCLYSIMMQYNNKNDIDEFYGLFKFYNYFTGFSYSAGNNRCDIFNEDLNDSFLKSTIPLTDIFNKCTTCEINELIIRLNNTSSKNIDAMNNIITKIQNYIKMCSMFDNNISFFVNYTKHLLNRLINKSSKLSVEKELIHIINFKDETEFYIKMLYAVQDMELSEFITTAIHDTRNVDFSEKWIDLDKIKINNKICSYTLIRNYAWECSSYENMSITEPATIPIEIEYYISILKAMLLNQNGSFSQDFNNRNINVHYDVSTITLKLQFDDLYYVKMTLLQSIVYMIINDNDGISATELEKIIKISLGDLSHIINSLISIRLINRDMSENNDVNMKFSIVPDFNNINTNIDLVIGIEKFKNGGFYEQCCDIEEAKIHEDKIKLLHYFVANPTNIITLHELITHSNDQLGKIENNELMTLLQMLIDSNFISINGLGYKYIEHNDNDDDSSCDESEQDSDDATILTIDIGNATINNVDDVDDVDDMNDVGNDVDDMNDMGNDVDDMNDMGNNVNVKYGLHTIKKNMVNYLKDVKTANITSIKNYINKNEDYGFCVDNAYVKKILDKFCTAGIVVIYKKQYKYVID